MTHKKAAGYANTRTAHFHNMHRDSITQFSDAMRAAGIAPPDVIEADGSGLHGMGTRAFEHHYGLNELDMLALTIEALQ